MTPSTIILIIILPLFLCLLTYTALDPKLRAHWLRKGKALFYGRRERERKQRRRNRRRRTRESTLQQSRAQGNSESLAGDATAEEGASGPQREGVKVKDFAVPQPHQDVVKGETEYGMENVAASEVSGEASKPRQTSSKAPPSLSESSSTPPKGEAR